MPSASPKFFAFFVFCICTIPLTSHAQTDKLLAEIASEAKTERLIGQVTAELNAKRYDKALDLINEAEEIDPDNPMLANARAAALIQLERTDEARTVLIALVEENPSFFQADYNLGEILFLNKDYQAASEHFRRMQNTFGAIPLLRFKLLLCEILSGQELEAGITLRTFRYPADAPAWYYAHAAMAASKGDQRSAKQLVRTVERIHGMDATALFRDTLSEVDLLK